MNLVSYTYGGATKLGAVLQDRVLDMEAAIAGRNFPELSHPHSGISTKLDMFNALQNWAEILPIFMDIMDMVEKNQREQPGLSLIPLTDVALAPPLKRPGKIICVGLNYADHCREQNLETPERPILFAKFPTAIIGPDEAIEWPADASQKVDFEAELALVIGKQARHIPTEYAFEYIAGYMNANDVSARDVQFSDGQWVRGKSFDTFCPIGPYLVTRDEVVDPHNLSIRLTVNGALLQDSNTNQMIFKIPEIVSFISHTCTLLPGDIICTGTPAGVGVFRDPQVFLQRGDVVEIEIGKLGQLRNQVI